MKWWNYVIVDINLYIINWYIVRCADDESCKGTNENQEAKKKKAFIRKLNETKDSDSGIEHLIKRSTI